MTPATTGTQAAASGPALGANLSRLRADVREYERMERQRIPFTIDERADFNLARRLLSASSSNTTPAARS